MIIVSGCSFACGEWQRGDLRNPDNGILHGGLSQYITENLNKPTVNLGVPAGSNLQVAQKIYGWIERHSEIPVEKIIVFQTEYTRDVKMIYEEDYLNFTTSIEFANILISRFYSRLSKISKIANCPIYLVGGVSDIAKLDDIEKHYPGLHIACHSLTNLVINNISTIDTPVLSWYDSMSTKFIERIKPKLSTVELENFIKEIDAGLERENLIFGTPEYFWPDGIHPNRKAHKKLFDFLLSQGIL